MATLQRWHTSRGAYDGLTILGKQTLMIDPSMQPSPLRIRIAQHFQFIHLRATCMTRVCPFQLRELHGRIILWQEAPKVDITEERAHLPQGALSLAKK